MTLRITQRAEAAILVAGVIIAAIWHGLLVINGFGEADAARLAIAAAEWHETGGGVHTSYLFRTSPLYLHALKLVLDAGVSMADLPALLNGVGVAIGSATLVPLYYLWRSLAGRAAASAGTVLFAVTPAFWLANLYGMAHVPAFALFVVALLLFANAMEPGGGVRTLPLAASALLATTALAIKADMVLCYGAFLGVVLLLRSTSRKTVLLALAIPVVALCVVLGYSRLVAPSMSTAADFASSWSGRFPFTVDAWTDVSNRRILIESFGWCFLMVAILAAIFSLVIRRYRRPLILCGLWAVPLIAFWGSILGNSMRHMMAGTCALTYLVAIVVTGQVSNTGARVAAIVALVGLNYVLYPLVAARNVIQRHVTNLQTGARAFALLPVPARIYVGGPGVPYAVFHVMSRAATFEAEPSTEPTAVTEIGAARSRLRYAVTGSDGETSSIGVIEAVSPYEIGPIDDWFLFAAEPGILVTNRMRKWLPFLRAAVEADPTSVSGWAIDEQMKIQAGLLLADTGRYEAAMALFAGALDINAESASGLYYGGRMLLQLGRSEEGDRLLERFLRLYPGDERADWARHRLRSNQP